MATKPNTEYSADSIRVLRGLDPVKKRPGMYTHTESPTHIVFEVVDNAADEALAGEATRIDLTVYRNGSIEVKDDGRGIPIGVPEGEKRPAVELVFTQLHAGGKFDKEDGGAYKFSGGLHGVGVSVTNALSTRLEVEVKRDGAIHQIVFADGDVEIPLQQVGKCLKSDHGTKVTCWPDGKYFDSPNVSMSEIEHMVRSKAVLMPGTAMRLLIEVDKAPLNEFNEPLPGYEIDKDGKILQVRSWVYPGGLSEYLQELCPEDAWLDSDGNEPLPIIAGEMYMDNGEGAAWALSVRQGASGRGESYVNLIPTLSGGTHEAGFRNGIFDAVRSFADHHALMPRNLKLTAEDCWSNVQFVLSSKILDPQFKGQVKEKLSSREAVKVTTSATYPVLESWLNQNPSMGKRIAEMAIQAATMRSKSVAKVEKRKTSGISILPAKLSDCEVAGTMEAEVFLVEGDSAGGSAKMGRDRRIQAILPVKGKIKNTWADNNNVVLGSKEVHDVFLGVGINPHTLTTGKESDLSGLRYGKVCILSDADVDGSHIQVLFLTLFIRHAPELIRQGRLYIAMPPLYRIDVPSKGKNKPEQKVYVGDDKEKLHTIDRLVKEGFREDQLTIQRFKGLGEMNPAQLWETTLCPDTRRLVKVVMTEEEMTETLELFDMMMATEESGQRREWMENKGHLVEADI